ncbi:MAG: hypothetical protein ACI8RN_001202 [Glaciecola sp.]|jgi:hypothetical protein|uniref:nuclear transport factor 2 family protein n=1 Tax=Congregibacter sp. TaxID=2744308 RepID=UPI0039E6CC93
MATGPVCGAHVAAFVALATCISAVATNEDNRPFDPTPEALASLDRQTIEAFLDGDADRYGQRLSDSFVMHENGQRMGKTDAMSLVSGIKCQVEDRWELDQPTLMRITDAVYILSYVRNIDGACTFAGTSSVLPSPVRATTLWVLDSGRWLAGYHGENHIVDLAAPPFPQPPPLANAWRATEPAVVSLSNSLPLAAVPLTKELLAVETAVWETWRAHDASSLEELTAEEISFINIFGGHFANKSDTIENWTGPLCDVESFRLSDAHASLVTTTVGILTVKGTVNGACGGQDIGGQELYATTIYVKQSDVWKWAFGFNSP